MHSLTRWFDTLTVADSGRNVWDRYAAPTCRRRGFVALLAAGLLAGCGQSGPLTLPTRDVEATTAPVAELPVAPESEASAEPESEASAEPESEASAEPESRALSEQEANEEREDGLRAQ